MLKLTMVKGNTTDPTQFGYIVTLQWPEMSGVDAKQEEQDTTAVATSAEIFSNKNLLSLQGIA